jgi:hypothetical protein
MAKQKEPDRGLWFFNMTGSQIWHVTTTQALTSLCGKVLDYYRGVGTYAVPNGERICSKCLHKLEKALGEAHRIVNVGD